MCQIANIFLLERFQKIQNAAKRPAVALEGVRYILTDLRRHVVRRAHNLFLCAKNVTFLQNYDKM